LGGALLLGVVHLRRRRREERQVRGRRVRSGRRLGEGDGDAALRGRCARQADAVVLDRVGVRMRVRARASVRARVRVRVRVRVGVLVVVLVADLSLGPLRVAVRV